MTSPAPSKHRTTSGMLRVVHVITDLDVGGTEINLLRLIKATRGQISHSVISLKRGGSLADQIRTWGIPVASLDMRPGFPALRPILSCKAMLRSAQPHLVHTWMYHANLVGGLAARLTGIRPVVWGIHHTHSSPGMSRRTRAVVQAGAWLSRWIPTTIICGGISVRAVHVQLGYCAQKLIVIHNGYDVDQFTPDARVGSEFREENRIPSRAFVFGMAARLHPDKDPENFLDAAAEVHKIDPGVRFMWCGEDVAWENRQLAQKLAERDLEGCFHLLGVREDMPQVYNAMDVLVSSSRSEALPNTIGEAMACALPCIATDVGDVKHILGDTGRIVPPQDPQALRCAMLELRGLSYEERRTLGRAARRRVVSDFHLSKVVSRHLQLYRELVERVEG